MIYYYLYKFEPSVQYAYSISAVLHNWSDNHDFQMLVINYIRYVIFNNTEWVINYYVISSQNISITLISNSDTYFLIKTRWFIIFNCYKHVELIMQLEGLSSNLSVIYWDADVHQRQFLLWLINIFLEMSIIYI